MVIVQRVYARTVSNCTLCCAVLLATGYWLCTLLRMLLRTLLRHTRNLHINQPSAYNMLL